MPTAYANARPVPAAAGIGLRSPHYGEWLEHRPPVAWLEAHSENYFGAGGEPLAVLERLRQDYPVSLHGVGLSLGSVDPLDRDHLARLRALCARIQPGLVSEHLAWTSVGGRHFNSLLPLPYTEEALAHFASRVEQAQEALGRALLIENPSTYLEFAHSSIPEHEFMAALAERTGCALLIDVNNVYVQARNHGLDATHYLASLPAERVGEVHLAGHSERDFDAGTLLIDTHDARVCPAVWDLYRDFIARIGPRPTLIEWDAELPALDVLLDEAARAQAVLEAPYEHAS